MFIYYLWRQLSVFRNVFGQRALVKYIEALTFHFPSLYGLCSRYKQLKVERRRYTVCLQLSPFGPPSDWTLYRTTYCVLTRNGGGRGGDSSSRDQFLASSLCAQTSAIFLTESYPHRPGNHWTVFAVPSACRGGVTSLARKTACCPYHKKKLTRRIVWISFSRGESQFFFITQKYIFAQVCNLGNKLTYNNGCTDYIDVLGLLSFTGRFSFTGQNTILSP